jgi:hypothetical protein
VSSDVTLPLIIAKTNSPVFAANIAKLFEFAYNTSATFRSIISKRVSLGGGIELFGYNSGLIFQRPYGASYQRNKDGTFALGPDGRPIALGSIIY